MSKRETCAKWLGFARVVVATVGYVAAEWIEQTYEKDRARRYVRRER